MLLRIEGAANSLVHLQSLWHSVCEEYFWATTTPEKSHSADHPVTKDTIANALSRAIHEHRLAPGTKLGEDELSDIYGVSRTIVRAALQALAHQQIIEITRNRGAFIAKPGLIEAHEVFEARELLEPRTERSAAKLSTYEDILLLQSHISQEHAALNAGDYGRALFLSRQFHLDIARIANQQTIADKDASRAEELTQSHLVDLHSALDLREQPAVQHDLRDLLLRPRD